MNQIIRDRYETCKKLFEPYKRRRENISADKNMLYDIAVNDILKSCIK